MGRFGPAIRRQEADSVGSIPLGFRLVSLLSEKFAIARVPGARAVFKKVRIGGSWTLSDRDYVPPR